MVLDAYIEIVNKHACFVDDTVTAWLLCCQEDMQRPIAGISCLILWLEQLLEHRYKLPLQNEGS